MSDLTLNLQNVINLLSNNDKFHICIHDYSGFTQPVLLELVLANYIHASPFCETAKKTTRGMKRCFACKVRAIKKASTTTEPFIGMCPMGLYEIVMPLEINGKPRGIIFIGNIASEADTLTSKIRRGSSLTGVPEKELLALLPTLSNNRDFNYYLKLTAFLKNYIQLLYNEVDVGQSGNHHWAVEAVKRYAGQYYNKNLQISGVAELYHLNSNYIGRLFKQETGISFSGYLNDIRIKKACTMLKATEQTIIEISMAVGYDNVTYFNRVFKQQMGMTPSEYRD